jgi:hypothetical protein
MSLLTLCFSMYSLMSMRTCGIGNDSVSLYIWLKMQYALLRFCMSHMSCS